MISSFIRGLLLASFVASAATAEEFPLSYKDAQGMRARTLPANSGTHGTLRVLRLPRLKAEPAPKSAKPIYGQLSESPGQTTMAFRVDESGGTGRGYDQLIVDLNGNWDLTDDPVVRRDDTLRMGSGSAAYEIAHFIDIPAPAGSPAAALKARYFAEVVIQKKALEESKEEPMVGVRMPAGYERFVGNIRLCAAGYLETQAKIGGATYRLAVLDADANFTLGNGARKPITYRSSLGGGNFQENWYVQAGDILMCDDDGSGSYEYRPIEPESRAFGPLAYFGGKPYRIAVSGDMKTLSVEPWTGPLGELVLQEQGGARVGKIAFSWERSPGDWQIIAPDVVDGKVRVPAGNYRLAGCSVVGPEKQSERCGASSVARTLVPSVALEASESKAFVCGGPLVAKLDTRKGAGTSGMLTLNATLLGSGGETYSSVMRGTGFRSRPPPPAFRIATQDGKEVASGNMEYG